MYRLLFLSIKKKKLNVRIKKRCYIVIGVPPSLDHLNVVLIKKIFFFKKK